MNFALNRHRSGSVTQKETSNMQNVIYAASAYGYCVQVIEGSEIAYEYTAGITEGNRKPTWTPVRQTLSHCGN